MHGIDRLREMDLKAKHEAEAAEEARGERVDEETGCVQKDQPDLTYAEARMEAEERLRQKDEEAEEMMAANQADELAERRMR